MQATHNTLSDDTRESMVALLNQQLADAIHLVMHAKAGHWGVRGPGFMSLHKLFDEVHEAAEKHVDLIAERITALGGATESTLSTVLDRSRLGEYPLQIADVPAHVEAMSQSLATFSEGVRNALDTADKSGDPATADLLADVLRETDKYLWFVEAHQPVKESAGGRRGEHARRDGHRATAKAH